MGCSNNSAAFSAISRLRYEYQKYWYWITDYKYWILLKLLKKVSSGVYVCDRNELKLPTESKTLGFRYAFKANNRSTSDGLPKTIEN